MNPKPMKTIEMVKATELVSGKFICTEDYTTCEIGPGTDVLTVTVLSFIYVGNGVGAGTGYPIGSDGISAGFIFLT
jgi:hypothetical protein